METKLFQNFSVSDREHRMCFDTNAAPPATITGTVVIDSELMAASALADAAAANPTTPTMGVVPLLMNATTVDRQRAVVDTLDSTGTGIAAAGIVGQFDDASTTAVTENKFAPVRISSRRALLVEGVASGTTIPVTEASASAALTALQLLDDTVYTDDAAFTPATSKVLAVGFEADETSADSVDEGDIGVARMTLDRRQRVANKSIEGPGEPTIDSYTHAAFNLAAGADQVLVSSAANKQIWVYGINFTVNVAGTVSFQDEDNTAITGVMQFGATGGMAIGPSGNFSMPIWKLATDKDLEVDVVTSELDGSISYAIVSV